MYASAQEIRLNVCEMLKPPARVTVAESIANNLRVVNPSGSPGNWSARNAPYMVEPVNLARSRLYEAVVFAGPARSGKTIALVDGVLAYSIVDDPADMLIVQTNQAEAEDYAKRRIRRGIEASPELAKRQSPRAHDNNVLFKMFRSGMILRIGWPSMGIVSGKDIKRAIATDVDNMTGDLSIDELWGLLLKRIQTFGSSGIAIAESSPAKDWVKAWSPKTPHEAPPVDGILSLYNRGDRRRWHWPCPECREPFEAAPGLSLFKVPPIEELIERVLVEDPLVLAERFQYAYCPHCGVGIDGKYKDGMNQRGRWVGEGQKMWPDGSVTGELLRSRTASFWLGGAAAGYQSWVSLVERYFQAVRQYAQTGEQKPLKSTCNVDQAMPFKPLTGREERDAHALQERTKAEAEIAPEWVADLVPNGVRFLVASVDVQAGKRAGFVVQVTGVGPNNERWIVDRYTLRSSRRDDGKGGFLRISPAAYAEDWDRLIDKVITRRYALADGSGRTMPILRVAIDCGGEDGVTERGYQFWRSLKVRQLHRNVRLVRGASSDNASRIEERFPDTRRRKDSKTSASGDVPVIFINTAILKDAVSANLKRETPGPGYYHFPTWLPRSFFEELTAESRGAKRWENPNSAPNESFDLEVYNSANCLLLKAEQINWERPPAWALPWDSNPEIRRPDVEPEIRVVPKKKLRRAASKYLGR